MHYQHITIRKPKNTIGRRHYCILIQKMHSLQICTKGTIFFVSTNDRKRALVDYVIFHVNICHILNKFKHIFFISLLKNICTANNAGYIRILPAVVYFNSHTRSACHVARRLLRHVNFEWKNKICDTFKLWYIYPQNDPSSLQMTLDVSFFIAKCL